MLIREEDLSKIIKNNKTFSRKTSPPGIDLKEYQFVSTLQMIPKILMLDFQQSQNHLSIYSDIPFSYVSIPQFNMAPLYIEVCLEVKILK